MCNTSTVDKSKGKSDSRMKLLLLSFVLLTVALPLNARVQVVWGTDVWEGYTEPDGTGFYQELIALIFPDEDFDVDIQYLAWKRVSRELKRQNIDMTGALHKSSDYHLSELPVLSERILVLSREGIEPDIGSTASLENVVGAYRTGYEDDIFYEIVPSTVPGVPVDSPSMAIKLLENGKIDYYVELASMLSSHAHEVEAGNFNARQVGMFHLYWAFAKSQKGRYIKRHFDGAFRLLREKGKLTQLYTKYRLVHPGGDLKYSLDAAPPAR